MKINIHDIVLPTPLLYSEEDAKYKPENILFQRKWAGPEVLIFFDKNGPNIYLLKRKNGMRVWLNRKLPYIMRELEKMDAPIGTLLNGVLFRHVPPNNKEDLNSWKESTVYTSISLKPKYARIGEVYYNHIKLEINDLYVYNGQDMTNKPFKMRYKLLKTLTRKCNDIVEEAPTWEYVYSAMVFQTAELTNWEGIIMIDKDSKTKILEKNVIFSMPGKWLWKREQTTHVYVDSEGIHDKKLILACLQFNPNDIKPNSFDKESKHVLFNVGKVNNFTPAESENFMKYDFPRFAKVKYTSRKQNGELNNPEFVSFANNSYIHDCFIEEWLN